jgi:putative peptidoglycan binding protein
MKTLIALLIAGTCAFAYGAKPAADQTDADAPSQKPKNVQKQPITPRQQQAPPKTTTPKAERATTPKKEEATEPITDSKKTRPSKTKRAPADDDDDDENTGPATDTHARKGPANKENVEKIRTQHSKFQAKPSATIATAQFNPNYRIAAAQNWEGAPYEIFRSYQPQWHDQAWYHSRYNQHLQLIAGGWYFWEAGYWFPAWGYDESAAYYPYDGPIYVGQNPRPFDQVVADVQAGLRERGYYHGEIDGLVGPLTREALTAYQTAQGLPPTAALDQPTLESLGLG